MTEVTLPNAWAPRDYQGNLWAYLKAGGLRAVEIAHRRWGKDDVALHHAACAAHERVGTYWHMLPEASQARKAIWDAVNPHTGIKRIDEAFPPSIRESTRNNDMFIRCKNGSTWQVVGSDNYNSLVGSPPVGVVFSEWALADPNAWAYLRPIMRENGGWVLFITTPRGRNHAATIYQAAVNDPDWFAERSPAHETSVFSAGELESEKREYIREFGRVDGEARFRQEYEVDFDVAVAGSYFGAEMLDAEDKGRITRVPHDPALKVITAWDLGFDDMTAIWFLQRCLNGEVHAIDYHENSNLPLEHYAGELQRRQVDEGYIYGEHLWPHDGSHRTLASGGEKLSTMFAKLGFHVNVLPQMDLLPGIALTRQRIQRTWFDEERCAPGIEALRSYHREWDDRNKVYKQKPKHDWASHGADAFRTFAVSYETGDRRVDVKPGGQSTDYGARKRKRRGSAWAA